MFATRTNQENAIYEQQTAAAAKPLNQGIKGLAPKTPGNQLPKTPFRGGKNDENRTLNFGKTGGKDGKVDRNAFVTPANPRTRAPLGNKTTNAKALLTPGLGGAGKTDKAPASNKLTSPRQRRPKIKVHESTSVSTQQVPLQEPEEREIEYMPPRGVPLPDHDDDLLAADLDFSVLQGRNLTRGWYAGYNAKEDNDEDSELSDFEERIKEIEEKNKVELKKTRPAPVPASKTIGQRPAPGSMKARQAASALAAKPTKSTYANSTASARARQPTIGTAPMFKKKAALPSAANSRFTAAKVASNSTIGYSKGRAVSASTHRPLSGLHTKSDDPEDKTSLAELLGLRTLHIDDNDGDLGLSARSDFDLFAGEEEEDVFQLDAVQDV